MPALKISDLNNGKVDVDHIAEIATSEALTAVDRLGHEKLTVKGAINSIKAFNVRGAFVAGTAYAMKDVYTSGGVAYVALVDHVATTVAADLAAGKVAVHQGATREDLAASGGAGLVAWIRNIAGAVKVTIAQWLGWQQPNVFEFLTDAKRADVTARTALLDVYAEFQACINGVAAAGGGTISLLPGLYCISQPLLVPKTVNIVGAGKESTTIRKTTAATKHVSYLGGVFSGPYPGTPPSDMNAVIILDGPSGYYSGIVSDLAVEGYFAVAGNYESQAVEFGIISTGYVSDSVITRTYSRFCKYGYLLPSIFATEFSNNRAIQCLGGFGINEGTSTEYFTNYATSCRDYGHYLRGMKYSTVSANACDQLNRPDFYPNRTRICSSYVFSGSLGLKVHGNGQETNYGRHWEFRGFDESVFECNNSTNLGSDFIGAGHIAIIYSTDTMRGSKLRNNFCHDYNPAGLLIGTAVAANHHNVYFEGQANVSEVETDGALIVRSGTTGSAVTDAGWGNDVPSNWVNVASIRKNLSSITPALSAATLGNLVVTYNPGNKHYAQRDGKMVRVWGCFDVTLAYTTASSYLTVAGLPVNNTGALWKIGVLGVDYNGSSLTKKLGSFRINDGSDGGIAFDDGDNDFSVTDIPSGTRVAIFYEGTYLS